MTQPTLDNQGLRYAFALLLVVSGTAFAFMGWSEALNLDVDRSAMFSRGAGPIATGWQPIAMGAVTLLISGAILVSILRTWLERNASRSLLALLACGMAAWFAFGLSGIVAGIESFRILEERQDNGEIA